MLRCIGAAARDIRRVFGSEGILLAFLGWILGIPVGYLIGRLTWLAFAQVMDVNPPYYYPAINIAIVFLITIVITLLVIQFPLRRATKLRPGDAIRYQ
jgi:ABC-type lipoprotein release transport system permease subunit